MKDPRAAAREWLTRTISKHLRADLAADVERVQRVAYAFEAESYASDIPIEVAIEAAMSWAEETNNQNKREQGQ